MSVQKNTIFEQKQALRKAHQLKCKQEENKEKQAQNKIKQAEQFIHKLKLEIQSLKQKIAIIQQKKAEIHRLRSNTHKQLSQFAQNKEKYKKQKEALIRQLKLVQEQLRDIKTVSSQSNSTETAKIYANSNIVEKKNINLQQKQAQINQQLKHYQQIFNNNQKKLQQVNSLVQQQQSLNQQIKQINQMIKTTNSKNATLQKQLQKAKQQKTILREQIKKAVQQRQDSISYLPYPSKDETVFISNEGLQWILQNYDPKIPEKYYYWSSDYKVQMPIFLKKQGFASKTPITLIQMWRQTLQNYGDRPALTFEVGNNVWKSLTYKQYYDECIKFGKACIAMGLSHFAPVMIIGFNSPEWVTSFYGAIFGHFLPIGLYTTNSAETCEYIANHCAGEIAIVEDKVQLQKYVKIIKKCPSIKYLVIYKEAVPADLPSELKGRVFTWAEFLQKGEKFTPSKVEDSIEYRQQMQKPGHCASFIYTSGTTGMPKGVMLSHDNYTSMIDAVWQKLGSNLKYFSGNGRVLTYLPFNHLAAQAFDLLGTVKNGNNLYFPDSSVLKNNMLKFLLIARPTLYIGVPRIWQKLQQKLAQTITNTTGLKRKLLDWAMSLGIEGTFAQIHNKSTPTGWSIAKLLFNKIKESLGLENCQVMFFGGAPLKQSTRKFFLQLNFTLNNLYGMSETGASNISDKMLWTEFSEDYLKEAGTPLEGIECVIDGQDQQGKGQICIRGRTRFLGYYKSDQQNLKSIDRKGFFRSGDEGRIDAKNNIYITGRIKQLIITAGGQNIPPVVIQNQILSALPIISQVVAIGDHRKFLTCLITLKIKSPEQLADQVVEKLKAKGSQAKTPKEAAVCPIVKQIINKGLQQANKKAISNAQKVQRFTILLNQFTIDSGELTPTMKLKRHVINQKYKAAIDAMYLDSKL